MVIFLDFPIGISYLSMFRREAGSGVIWSECHLLTEIYNITLDNSLSSRPAMTLSLPVSSEYALLCLSAWDSIRVGSFTFTFQFFV